VVIHPTAVIAEDATLGDGAEIGPFAVLGLDGEGDGLRIGPAARIRSHTVVYRSTSVGARFQSGHGVLVREATTIGDDVSIGTRSVVEHHVTMGDGVRLHTGCFVPELSVLEEGAWLGPGVIVTNARHPNRPDTKDKLEGVHIERGAVIGAGAVLLPGVRIGKGALVGAGAVVLRDVEAGAVIVGNPGRMLS
jgi:acetyltransferase-like isoleucine patch superfamily enzyme